jgi:DNA-directed RNA polymerase alpha subunit
MMSEQTTTTNATPLATLAERAAASSAWWKEGDQRNELELPTRVLHVLETAGITTVEQLKATGPHRLRKLDGLGKHAFDQIIEMLRALDREANGGES